MSFYKKFPKLNLCVKNLHTDKTKNMKSEEDFVFIKDVEKHCFSKSWIIQKIKERIKDLEALVVVSKGLNKDAEVFILECRLLEAKEFLERLEK